jgi:hypothetical protein
MSLPQSLESSTPISDAKRRRFEQMERELHELNARWERGERPPLLKYDHDEFREFRDWQAKRLAEQYPLEP